MLHSIKFAEFVATFGYIGKIKKAPGTFGSLMAFPLAYIIIEAVYRCHIIFAPKSFNNFGQILVNILVAELLLTIMLFFAGWHFTSVYLQRAKTKDPKEVVIDEVVGQMLVIIGVGPSVMAIYSSSFLQQLNEILVYVSIFVILPFGLFRFFDIIKPWPINWFDENIDGGLGVMIDDVIAALFAITMQYTILFLLP